MPQPDLIDRVFNGGDALLEMGGQTVLDVVGMDDGVVGRAAHGLQAGYHGAHALNDARHGNWRGAAAQTASAAWQGVQLVPGVGHFMHHNEWGQGAHIAETAWDGLTNGLNAVGGVLNHSLNPFARSQMNDVGTNEHGRIPGFAEVIINALTAPFHHEPEEEHHPPSGHLSTPPAHSPHPAHAAPHPPVAPPAPRRQLPPCPPETGASHKDGLCQ